MLKTATMMMTMRGAAAPALRRGAAAPARRALSTAAAHANEGEVEQDVPPAPRRFTRSSLIAEHYVELFSSSSVVLFVAGDISEVKAPLRELGFGVTRAKSSLIRITARKLAPEDDLGFEVASQLGKGITNLVYLQDPLLNLVASPEKLKALTKILPIAPVKDDKYKGKQMLMGGFMYDSGKTNSTIWFTRPGVDALFEMIKTEAKNITDPEGLTPHQLFQAKMVAGMRNQLGAIRTPLLKPGQAAVSTVRKIPENIASTLAKIKTLRQDEAQ